VRNVEVRLVKKKSDFLDNEEEPLFEDKAEIVAYYFADGVSKLSKFMLSYIFADTLRQVIVAQAYRRN
jgi:hypothetical protein